MWEWYRTGCGGIDPNMFPEEVNGKAERKYKVFKAAGKMSCLKKEGGGVYEQGRTMAVYQAHGLGSGSEGTSSLSHLRTADQLPSSTVEL